MNTNISKIVDEWSYRLSLIEGHDGLPDIESYSDLTVLKSVLTDYKWPVEITYELLYNMEHPLELLGEGEVPQLSMAAIRIKIRDYVVSNFKELNAQAGPELWLVPDPDDEVLFNKVVKKIKSGLKDYVIDAVLINTKSKADMKTPSYFAKSGDGVSNTFMYIAVQTKNTIIEKSKQKNGPNQWIHFKLNGAGSKSTGDGAPSQAARYEEGIVLWHNTFKVHKGNHADALAKASDYGISNMKTYNNFAGHMEETFGTKATGQVDGVGTLNHSGAVSFSIKADKAAGYVNKTAKSDIYDESGNDISVKKKGGSQLMSGKVGDSTGVFYGALKHYMGDSAGTQKTPLEKKVAELIAKMEKEFGKVTGDTGTRDIKKKFGKWYVTERIKDTKLVAAIKKITAGIEKVKKPSNDDKEIYEIITGKRTIKKGTSIQWGLERHAKWEAMEAAMIDRTSSKWENWQIPGVSKQGKSMDKWLEDYIGTLPKELGKEAKQVIDLNQIHVELEKEVIKVFESKDFTKWIVYEAGSGYYKFEGNHNHSGKADKGSSHGSANKLLYFGKSGVQKPIDMNIAWAKSKVGDVSVNLGYKSSGQSKFTALRLLQNNLEKDGNLLTESEQNYGTLFEYDINKILNGEIKVLQEEINHCNEMLNELYLMEGFFSKMGAKLKKGVSAIKKMAKKVLKRLENAISNFWENLKDKVFGTLYEYLKKGFEFFMDALGAEVTPTGDSIVLKA